MSGTRLVRPTGMGEHQIVSGTRLVRPTGMGEHQIVSGTRLVRSAARVSKEHDASHAATKAQATYD